MPILIQAVDFLRGIHDFPAAGALGIHCRGSQGRRRRLGAPRSRCDIPRRAPHGRERGGRLGAGVGSRRRARDEPAARRAGRAAGTRRGLAPGGGRASPARARLRLGLRAARSASLALQVPVTHTDTRSRPSRSLAPPPRRRRAGQTHRRAPTEVAANEHVGHRGREGKAGEGEGRARESAAGTAGCDCEAWGRAWCRSRHRSGQVGGAGEGSGVGPRDLRPARPLPFLLSPP